MLNNGDCFRLIIQINKHYNLKLYQVLIQHPDLTTITASLGDYYFLIILVYIPCITNRQEYDKEELSSRLNLISATYNEEKRSHRDVELIIAGDFNRWDSLWGGNEIQSDVHQGEALPIIDFILELGLQSLLPRGIITFFSNHDSYRRSSTIDLVLTSEKLANEVL